MEYTQATWGLQPEDADDFLSDTEKYFDRNLSCT
jgi:hypothetical protein